MAAQSTYDLLWSHQLVLLRDIEAINARIAAAGCTLNYVEQILARGDCPRKIKKSLKWTRTISRKTIKGHEKQARVLMEDLALCQGQIAVAHEVAQDYIVRRGSVARGPFTPLLQTAAEQSQNGCWDADISTGPWHLSAQNDQHTWAEYHMPDAAATSQHTSHHSSPAVLPWAIPQPMQCQPPISFQPYEHVTSEMEGAQYFPSQEISMTSPLTAVAAARPAPLPGTLASQPRSSNNKATELNPAAEEFSSKFVPRSGSLTDHATNDIQPVTSPFAEARVSAPQTKHGHRYSEAAISLIENRLKNKAEQDSGCCPKGVVRKRRGKSVDDVAVEMTSYGKAGKDISWEVMWPLSA